MFDADPTAVPAPADEKELFGWLHSLAPRERDREIGKLAPPAAARMRSLFRYADDAPCPLDLPAVEAFGDLLDCPAPTLGEFEIERELGRGGMGVVYLARDAVLARPVALKLLPVSHRTSPAALDRMKCEARSAAALCHPNIVSVFQYRQEAGVCCLVMEYLPGGTLADALKAGSPADPVERWRLVYMISRIAEALAHAHRVGILHLDVKPSNILLDAQGEPKLCDFGIARSCSGESARDGTSGTSSYASPEQLACADRQPDCRADVYSLGLVLYEAITRKRAFDGPDRTPIHAALLHTLPPRPRRLVPQIDRRLEAICLKAIESNPADRYQSAAHFADDLRAWLNSRPAGARRARTRTPSLALLALSALLVLVLAVGIASIGAKRSTGQPLADHSPVHPAVAPSPATISGEK